MRGGGLNDLRADHQILKEAFLLEGSSSIYRGSADFPEGPACNLQPDILFVGSSLSRWRHPCWRSATGRRTQLTQLPLTWRALHGQKLAVVVMISAWPAPGWFSLVCRLSSLADGLSPSSKHVGYHFWLRESASCSWSSPRDRKLSWKFGASIRLTALVSSNTNATKTRVILSIKCL